MTKKEDFLMRYSRHLKMSDDTNLATIIPDDPEMEHSLDEVIKEELEKFALILFNTGELRSGINYKEAAKERIQEFLNKSK